MANKTLPFGTLALVSCLAVGASAQTNAPEPEAALPAPAAASANTSPAGPDAAPADTTAAPASAPPASSGPAPAPAAAKTSYAYQTDLGASANATAKPTDPWDGANWYLALDRLTGFGFWSISRTEPNRIEVTESGTALALAGGGVNTGAAVPLNPYAVPRLSLDGKVSRRATLGLGLGGIVTSGEITGELNGVTQSADGERRWLIAITPRVGYMIPATDMLKLWLRAGGTYAVQRTQNPITALRARLTSIDVEAIGLFRLGDRTAIATTLALALPVYGFYAYDVDPARAASLGLPTHSERNFSMTSFSAQLGVVVAL